MTACYCEVVCWLCWKFSVFTALQNIDLHALTGWIPERIAIRPGSDEFDAEKEFVRICDRCVCACETEAMLQSVRK